MVRFRDEPSVIEAKKADSEIPRAQSDMELGNAGVHTSKETFVDDSDGLTDRASTMQNLHSYKSEQKRLYAELPFVVRPGMRRRSFMHERSYPNLKPRSSWANLTRMMKKHGERQRLLEEEDDGSSEPGYTVPLLLSCFVALMSAFQYGYNTGVTGAIDPSVVFPGHSDMAWAVCVSIFAAGGPFGSLAGGQVSAQWGRKKALLLNACLFIVASALMGFAVDIYMLIAGRFLAGLASGTATVVVPLYLGELAPPNLRGALGTSYQFAMVSGILASDLMAFGFADESHGFSQPGWRVMFGFVAVPSVLQLVLAAQLAESPRWLLNKDKLKEAEHVLRWLRESEGDVQEELDSITSASANEDGDADNKAPGIIEVLCDRSIRFPLVVAMTLQFVQQLCGINAVMFYASSFFQNAGLENPLVGTTLVYMINVLSTAVALVLMDTAGRRPLLLSSVGGMVLSVVVLTVGLMDLLPLSSMTSVGGVMCFVWFFEIGLGPIPWLIAAEMFPPKSRTTATSIATMINWMGLFIIGLVFPSMQTALGDYIFVPFGALLVFAFGFVLKYVPETKGKTIDEIQEELHPQKD